MGVFDLQKSLDMIGVEFASEMQNEVQSSTFGTANLGRNMSNSNLILSLNLKLKIWMSTQENERIDERFVD